MDLAHPAIVAALESEAPVAHEGDSTFYVRLAMAAFDLNERLRAYRGRQADAVWRVIGMALISLQMHVDAERITAEQRAHLKHILSENIEEPTEENDLPIFKIPFPARQPDHRPPAA